MKIEVEICVKDQTKGKKKILRRTFTPVMHESNRLKLKAPIDARGEEYVEILITKAEEDEN